MNRAGPAALRPILLTGNNASRSPFVGRTGEDTAAGLSLDQTNTARAPVLVVPNLQVMPTLHKCRAGVGGNAALRDHPARKILVRFERARKADGGKSRGIDRLLRRHVKHPSIEQNLQHCLRLEVVTG